MTELTLIDTDVLIDVSREIPEALNCLFQIDSRSSRAISVVTQMELLVGCRNRSEQHSLAKFLTDFRVVPIDPIMSQIAVRLLQQYRLSHGLLIADALVAATSMALGMDLVTKNQKDYRFIQGLSLLAYPNPFDRKSA